MIEGFLSIAKGLKEAKTLCRTERAAELGDKSLWVCDTFHITQPFDIKTLIRALLMVGNVTMILCSELWL